MRKLKDRYYAHANERKNNNQLFEQFSQTLKHCLEKYTHDPEYQDLLKFIKTVTLKKDPDKNFDNADNVLIDRLAGDSPPWPPPDDYVVYTPSVYTDASIADHPNYVLSHPAFYANKYAIRTKPIENTVPVKSYNCFLKRLDPIRQSWFYLLIRNQLLDQGHVSFLMDASRAPGELHNRPQEFFKHCHTNYLTEFDAECEFCIKNNFLPYRSFEESMNLENVVMDTKFSIVVETYFCPESITFTEKTFRVLTLPRPWLLFCTKGAVKLLRSWGIDVLDDLVDHSQYDDIEFDIERQSKIIELSKNMLQFDTEKYKDRLEQAAQHNIELLNNWYQNWPALQTPSIEDAIVKVNKILKKLKDQNIELY